MSVVHSTGSCNPTSQDPNKKVTPEQIFSTLRQANEELREFIIADDLTQEFALKFVRGDYATLHPSRGRFRDFLTVVLRNLVIDHVRKKHALREKPATDQIDKFAGDTSEDHDRVFIEQWRRTLLERTWEVFRSAHSVALFIIRRS